MEIPSLPEDTDGIIFISDGVLSTQAAPSAISEKINDYLTSGVPLYALDPDLKARNIKPILANLHVIDYAGFVELIELYEKFIHIS